MSVITTLGRMASKALADAPRTADEVLKGTPPVVPTRSPVAPLKAVKQMGDAGATAKLEPVNLDDVDLPISMRDSMSDFDSLDFEAYPEDDILKFNSKEELAAFGEDELDNLGNLKPTETAPAPIKLGDAVSNPVNESTVFSNWSANFKSEFNMNDEDLDKISQYYVGKGLIREKTIGNYKAMLKEVTSNIEAGKYLKENYLDNVNFDSAYKLSDGTPMLFWRGVEDPTMGSSQTARDLFSLRIEDPYETGSHFGSYDQASDFSNGLGGSTTPLNNLKSAIESGKGRARGPLGLGASYLAPVIVNMKNPLKIPAEIGNYGPINMLRFARLETGEQSLGKEAITIVREFADEALKRGYINEKYAVRGSTVEEVEDTNRSLGKLLQDYIEKAGFDGVEYLNTNEGVTNKPSLIAFRNEQIITLDELIPDVKNFNKKQKEMFYSMVGLGVSIDVALKVMNSNNSDKS